MALLGDREFRKKWYRRIELDLNVQDELILRDNFRKISSMFVEYEYWIQQILEGDSTVRTSSQTLETTDPTGADFVSGGIKGAGEISKKSYVIGENTMATELATIPSTYLKLDASNDPMTGDLDMGSRRITQVDNVTGRTDDDLVLQSRAGYDVIAVAGSGDLFRASVNGTTRFQVGESLIDANVNLNMNGNDIGLGGGNIGGIDTLGATFGSDITVSDSLDMDGNDIIQVNNMRGLSTAPLDVRAGAGQDVRIQPNNFNTSYVFSDGELDVNGNDIADVDNLNTFPIENYRENTVILFPGNHETVSSSLANANTGTISSVAQFATGVNTWHWGHMLPPRIVRDHGGAWTSGIDVTFVWNNSYGGTGNVRWGIFFKPLDSTSNLTAGATASTAVVQAGSAASPVPYQVVTASATLVSIDWGTGEGVWEVRLGRTGANVNDTLNNTAQLHAVIIQWQGM